MPVGRFRGGPLDGETREVSGEHYVVPYVASVHPTYDSGGHLRAVQLQYRVVGINGAGEWELRLTDDSARTYAEHTISLLNRDIERHMDLASTPLIWLTQVDSNGVITAQSTVPTRQRTVDQIMAECDDRRVQIRYYLGTGQIQVREGLTLRATCRTEAEVEDAVRDLLNVTEEELGVLREHMSALLTRWVPRE